jgi:heterodisulfide reductase subunit A-like polyferredoxin/coenzyme F420-reducing hydrogenase delta subunit
MDSEKTLVIGSGPCARHITEELLARGDAVIVAVKENQFDLPTQQAEILTDTELISCRGTAGNFNFLMAKRGEKISRTAANVIVAEEAVRYPNNSLYGLTASDSVLALSRLKELLSDADPSLSGAKRIVFLTGLIKESNPVILEEMMRACLKLQSDFNAQTYIFTKNLKVAGNGLEALYRTTKEAGTVYIKFTETVPEIAQDDSGVTLTFTDEVLGGKFRLKPDITVADETVSPSEYVKKLAAILELDTDSEGFLQADNVHRISVLTNRKGILVAGTSRGIQSPDDLATETGNAVISVPKPELGNEGTGENLEGFAEISRGACVRCLTCYRVCPYRAILLNAKPAVIPDVCERCGICAAECPARAITIKGLTPSEIAGEIQKGNFPQSKGSFTPYLVAFCCQRSAARAGELASCMGHQLPGGLKIIEVPCAGSISHTHIFSAFQNNADGVLILTCHEGNCHSERGNLHARKRAEHITGVFSEAGFDRDRLMIKTLASNMAKEFAETVSQFEKKILEMGPSRLRN